MKLSELNPADVTKVSKSRLRLSDLDPSDVKKVDKAGILETALRGISQSVTLGFGDEIQAAIESALTDKTYVQSRDESRMNNAAARNENPLTYAAGELAGGVATAFAPGLNLAKGATMAARVGKAAALGGVYGLGNSTADLTKGEVKEAAVDTATGAALGGALQYGGEKIVEGAKKAVKPISEYFKDFAEKRAVKSAGAMLKDFRSLDGKPGGVNEFGRALLDETAEMNGKQVPIVGFGDTLEKVAAKGKALREQSGKKIGEIVDFLDDKALEYREALPDINARLSAAEQELADRRAMINMAKDPRLGLTDTQNQALARVEQEVLGLKDIHKQLADDVAQIADLGFSPVKVADKIEKEIIKDLADKPAWRQVVGRLRDEADELRRLGGEDGKKRLGLQKAQELKRSYDDFLNYDREETPMKEMIKRVRGIINKEIEEEVDKAGIVHELFVPGEGGPEAQRMFTRNKKLYGIGARAEEMAGDRALRDEANRMLSPSDHALGIATGMGSGIATGSPFTALLSGIAVATGNKFLRERGSSMAAVSADKIYKLLVADKNLFGKWSGAISKAARGGNKSLAVTIAILSKDPEFKAEFK